MELLISLAIGTLFGTGIFLMLRRNVIRSAIGLMVLANGVNLFLLSAGSSNATIPAYISDAMGIPSDPLPQALVLTAIVISMGGTAFVLAMLYIISARYKTANLDKIEGLKH